MGADVYLSEIGEELRKRSPVIHQKASLEKQKGKAVQAVDKLLDAYQEDLIPLAQLRKRMPELQRKVNAIGKDLELLKVHETALDERLQLLDVPSFTRQVDQNLNQLDITEKKKILRLLVKEIIVGDDTIEIKNSIPLKETKKENNEKSYQLCRRSDRYSRDLLGRDKFYWEAFPSKKLEQRIREKISDYLGANGHHPAPKIVEGLNAILRGWLNYFEIPKVSYPRMSKKRLRFYLYNRLYRYYHRKSQRKSRLYGQKAFEVLTTRFGLIDPTKYPLV